MKKISLIILILLAAAAVPATVQAQAHEDVVYLKNGSVIRGIVVEQMPGESLKIETRDGNLLVFDMNEVSRMTREVPHTYSRDHRRAGSLPAPTAERSKFNKPRGYIGLVELGWGAWFDGGSSRSVTMVNGYRFFPQLAIGGGVGMEVWDEGEVAVPMFLHLRSDFIKRRVSPFVALNVGGNVSTDEHSGATVELQGGVSFNVGRRNRMTVGLSYAACEYYHDHIYYSGDRYYYYDNYYSDIAFKLKVGFSF